VCAGRIAHVGDLPAKYRPSDWSAVTEPPQICATEQHAHMPTAPEFLFGDEGGPELLSAGALLADPGIADAATLPPAGIDLRAHLTQIERRLIEQALERSGGTVAHAARLLGLRRTTLVEKLRKLGLVSADAGTAELARLDGATED
jgi:sigma-54 dependent transcriptional regulator, flagellar regulatory protein